MKRIIIFAVFTYLLIFTTGCDSGPSSLGGSGTVVGFSVDCAAGVKCSSTSDINEYNSGDYHSVTCVWHCAAYKNQNNKYVSITFDKRGGGCWEYDREYVTGGICY
jgi:hypothetical protein